MKKYCSTLLLMAFSVNTFVFGAQVPKSENNNDDNNLEDINITIWKYGSWTKSHKKNSITSLGKEDIKGISKKDTLKGKANDNVYDALRKKFCLSDIRTFDLMELNADAGVKIPETNLPNKYQAFKKLKKGGDYALVTLGDTKKYEKFKVIVVDKKNRVLRTKCTYVYDWTTCRDLVHEALYCSSKISFNDIEQNTSVYGIVAKPKSLLGWLTTELNAQNSPLHGKVKSMVNDHTRNILYLRYPLKNTWKNFFQYRMNRIMFKLGLSSAITFIGLALLSYILPDIHDLADFEYVE